MLDFVLMPQNIPFMVALTVMLLIILIEGMSSIVGAGFSEFMDSLFPDLDFETGVDADSDFSGTLGKLLGWIRLGEVPVLVLLILLLVGYGLSGLILQKILFVNFGFVLPALVITVPAVCIGLFFVRVLGGVIGRLMPKEETSAISVDALIGGLATITLGVSKPNSPAPAKIRDLFGKSHYVRVVPDDLDQKFVKGDQVILVSRDSSVFKAIPAKSRAFHDEAQDGARTAS